MLDFGIPTAIYCRISRDGAESIINQESIAKECIDSQEELFYVKTYIDEHKTGTNFDRPGWQELMKDCESHRIGCIVVKDLSRIGRNLRETTKLLEETLPAMEVRVISISESYDSKESKYDLLSTDLTIQNLVNEYYARESSAKVRASLGRGQKKGEWYGKVPYGYQKSGKTIVPDPKANPVVEKIFSLAASGKGIAEIMNILNDEKILSPNGKKWTHPSIKRILTNRVYIGVYTAQKVQRLGDMEWDAPEKDWIVIPDNHTAIISNVVFDNVQRLLADKSSRGSHNGQDEITDTNASHIIKVRSKNSNALPKSLRDIMRCGICGRKLGYDPVNEEKRIKKAVYFCQYHTGQKSKGGIVLPQRPSIEEETLKQMIIEECNKCLERIKNGKPAGIVEAGEYITTQELEEHLKKLEDRFSEYDKEISPYYEKYVNDRVTTDQLKAATSKLDKKYDIYYVMKEINKTKLQITNLTLAETMRKEVGILRRPMTEFDEHQVLRMSDCIKLNADGTISINFTEEVAIAALIHQAYTGEFPEE
ncbi:MAG: recombinase family protein [Lachnospiraceae bacterium]|nr:recombinase family protein [Lachnospiraceae bacterium]